MDRVLLWLKPPSSQPLHSLPIPLDLSVPVSPHQSTLVHTSPHQSTPVHTSPHQSLPVHTSPHQSTPVHTIPHQSTPVHTSPNSPVCHAFLYHPLCYRRERAHSVPHSYTGSTLGFFLDQFGQCPYLEWFLFKEMASLIDHCVEINLFFPFLLQ